MLCDAIFRRKEDPAIKQHLNRKWYDSKFQGLVPPHRV